MADMKPHDRFFRKTLGDPRAMRDFVRHFFPEELKERLDLSGLQEVTGTFLDGGMREFFADLVYRVSVEDGEAYITLLFEHKSSPEQRLPLQLYHYLGRVWQKQWESGERNPPVIIPVLFYHSDRSWDPEGYFGEFLGFVPDWAQRFVPDFDYLTVEVELPDEDEKLSPKLVTYLDLVSRSRRRALRQRELEELLKSVMQFLDAGDKEYFQAYVRYIMEVWHLEFVVIKRAASTLPEKGRKTVMTVAEELRKEGWEQGREEGRKEGLKIARRMFLKAGKFKFGSGADLLEQEIERIRDPEVFMELEDELESVKSIEELKDVIRRKVREK